MAPVLGYWNLRGLAQPTRLLLEYAGADYQEKLYHISEGSAGAIMKAEWVKDKFNLGLDFPNLPYYIDGSVKLTQSVAINRHIARKHNLMGKPSDASQMEMVDQQLIDMRGAFKDVCYAANYDEKVGPYLSETVPVQLRLMSEFLANKNYLFGEISYVDFMLYEFLSIILMMDSSILNQYPGLKKLMTTIESLDRIKAYMSSNRFIKYPVNGPYAKFG